MKGHIHTHSSLIEVTFPGIVKQTVKLHCVLVSQTILKSKYTYIYIHIYIQTHWLWLFISLVPKLSQMSISIISCCICKLGLTEPKLHPIHIQPQAYT